MVDLQCELLQSMRSLTDVLAVRVPMRAGDFFTIERRFSCLLL